MNTNGLLNFNIDLKKCEEFAASRPVTGFAVGTLEMSFEELRQVSVTRCSLVRVNPDIGFSWESNTLS